MGLYALAFEILLSYFSGLLLVSVVFYDIIKNRLLTLLTGDGLLMIYYYNISLSSNYLCWLLHYKLLYSMD